MMEFWDTGDAMTANLTWVQPDFEDLSACMECTAYAETLS